jgi:hypothetical protein
MTTEAPARTLEDRVAGLEATTVLLTTNLNALLGAVNADADAAAVIGSFLDTVDADEIERVVMERMGWDGSGTSYTATLLAVLREQAAG